MDNKQFFIKDFMTLSQAAEYLNISTSCMYKKTHKRDLPFYRPGNKKIYFKRSDLDDFAFSNRQPSISEIKMDSTSSYLS